MPIVKLPTMQPGKTDKETVQNVSDLVMKLRKELEYALHNLDDDNVLSIDAAKIKHLEAYLVDTEGLRAEWIEADRISAEAIATDYLEADAAVVGTLTADIITAKEATIATLRAEMAEIDVVVSNTTITNVLSAQRGNIAELTVDQLETSDKVQKYLAGDKTDVNYIKVFDKNIEFITAIVADAIGEPPVTPTVQLKDRNKHSIYWLDATRTGTTLDVTAFPVMIYQYTEAVKLKMAFDDSESKIPKISFGQGVGNPTYPDRGKGFVYKDAQGLVLEYLTEAGVLKQLRIGEDGVLGDIVESLESLDFYTNGFKAEYGNRHVGYRWTKDGSGRITQLADIYTSDVVPVVWNTGVL